ncbi:MAG: hypothetical protein ACHQET_01880 [Chitinophagales bacterium]
MEEIQNNNPGRGSSRVWLALTLVVAGSAIFLQRMGLPLPEWLFSWQMLLITIGILMGFIHGFRGPAWLILIIVGGFFLYDRMIPGIDLHRFLWPFAIIAIGILMLVRPRRHRRWEHLKEKWERKDWSKYSQKTESYSSEDHIDATAVFGGIHKTILSKNFKGGDMTIFMGGAELNLAQADINGTVTLDITQVMGGTKLIVPPHWEIRSNLTSVFGNIEDKRQQDKVANPDKVLILDGTSVFGGIEIRNF